MSEEDDLIEEAEHKLSVARLLLENDEYAEAVSRAYYGMFHAARALLLLEGSQPRTHAGVASELGKLYRDRLDADLLSKFSTFQQLREDADYGIESDVDRERAVEVLETTEEFISKAESLVGREG